MDNAILLIRGDFNEGLFNAKWLVRHIMGFADEHDPIDVEFDAQLRFSLIYKGVRLSASRNRIELKFDASDDSCTGFLQGICIRTAAVLANATQNYMTSIHLFKDEDYLKHQGLISSMTEYGIMSLMSFIQAKDARRELHIQLSFNHDKHTARAEYISKLSTAMLSDMPDNYFFTQLQELKALRQ